MKRKEKNMCAVYPVCMQCDEVDYYKQGEWEGKGGFGVDA